MEQTPLSPARVQRILLLFTFAMFMQTTSALSIVGALGPVAAEWHVSPTAAALLVTAFGATFALSAPLLQMLLGHWVRRGQILTGLTVMTAGAIAFALAPNYPVLFSARVAMGLGAALLSPVLLALGSSLVAPKQQGAALATISMGISLAAVVGVPSAAALAAHIGPRALYGLLALSLAASATLIAVYVPDRSRGERVSPTQAWRLLTRPATLSGLSVVFFVTAGVFATFTMITPILRESYGAGPRAISLSLLLYGLAGVTGNLFVRRAASAYSAETLLRRGMAVLLTLFASLLALPHHLAFLLTAFVAWAFATDIIWPSQQRRMVELEPAFRGIALALSSSFLFSGMAFGSAVGGVAYAFHGYAAVLTVSMVLLAAGLGALGYSVRAKGRANARSEGKTVQVLVKAGPVRLREVVPVVEAVSVK